MGAKTLTFRKGQKGPQSAKLVESRVVTQQSTKALKLRQGALGIGRGTTVDTMVGPQAEGRVYVSMGSVASEGCPSGSSPQEHESLGQVSLLQ